MQHFQEGLETQAVPTMNLSWEEAERQLDQHLRDCGEDPLAGTRFLVSKMEYAIWGGGIRCDFILTLEEGEIRWSRHTVLYSNNNPYWYDFDVLAMRPYSQEIEIVL